MAAHFSPEAMKFLRGLARNNDRIWFDARKQTYETELKAPMLAVISELNQQLESFAPEHVRPPQKVMMRIYRDIRFSANKSPYKTQIAGWWSREGLEKTSGAGYYFSVSPSAVVVAAGVYMPEKAQLLAIRRHLVEHYAELRSLLEARKMKAAFKEFEGAKLTRPPKGFAGAEIPADAMGLILCRQWGVSATLPADVALGDGFVKEIASRFKLASPMVALLNEPLLQRPRKPLF